MVLTSALSYSINCGLPPLGATADLAGQLKFEKTSGEDRILMAVCKMCLLAVTEPLLVLFRSMWGVEEYSSDRNTSVLLPFPKIYSRALCGNYRDISLLDVVVKAFTQLVLNPFAVSRHARTQPNQGGFCSGSGYIDRIFILKHWCKSHCPPAACRLLISSIWIERQLKRCKYISSLHALVPSHWFIHS